ncbi:hypothetical protein KDM41_09190 [bacterium]|nr:hypothetical protein [bacterium]
MTGRRFATDRGRAACAALLVSGLLAVVPAPLRAWSEFGTEADEPETPATGPEIVEPFFAFLVGLADADSLGAWSGADLAAWTAASGRESRFPLTEVVRIERRRPQPERAGRFGPPVRADWRLELAAAQDRPMPYSILGYHPGSLRVARVLELAELAPLAFSLELPADDDAVRHVQVDSCRVFALEGGHVLLDADGWLDALLGAGLDDSWTLGFVTARTEGELVGLAVSLGRDGRRIYGEFDFRADKVLAHGRPLANALSRTSRAWLDVAAGNLPDPWVE